MTNKNKQNRQLTEKQKLFCKYMFTVGGETFGNGLESARKAGYRGNNNTLKQIAHKMVTNGNCLREKEQIQAETAEKIEYNRDIALKMLTEAYDMAKFQHNPAALTGVIREMNAITGLHSQTIKTEDITNPLRQDELEKWQEKANKLGIGLAG